MNFRIASTREVNAQPQSLAPATVAKYRHQRSSRSWWKDVSIPVACSSLTMFGAGSAAYPPLLLVPVSGLLLCLLKYEIQFLQSFTHKKRWLLSAFVVVLVLGMTWGAIAYTSQPANAAFSFLFADTETVLKNCVLKSITAAAAISGIIFGGMRVAFMVGVAVAGYNIWTQRQQGQDFHDTLQIVITAILVVVIIGAIEPLVVGTGSCG